MHAGTGVWREDGRRGEECINEEEYVKQGEIPCYQSCICSSLATPSPVCHHVSAHPEKGNKYFI